MLSQSFAFVLNPFHYEGALPIELLPGAYLDRATQSQLKLINEIREQSGRAGRSLGFEREPIPEHVRKSPQWDRKLWPRTTFWVINFEIDSEEVIRFRRASQLTDNELEFGAVFPPENQLLLPRIEFPWAIESYFDMAWRNNAQSLKVEDLLLARQLLEKLSAFRTDIGDRARNLVVRAFDDFVELSHEHRISHLRLLGLFGLIEALITHDPASSGQRLSHQVRTKMPLLMRRWTRLLPARDFFSIDDPPTIWTMLYRVRSCYAHGEKPDFDDAFKQLGSLLNVFRFVRESLKRLLIFALDEPRLILDLKEC
jgi:hypothetical protein